MPLVSSAGWDPRRALNARGGQLGPEPKRTDGGGEEREEEGRIAVPTLFMKKKNKRKEKKENSYTFFLFLRHLQAIQQS